MQTFEIKTSQLLLNLPTEKDLVDFLAQINSTDEYSKNLFNIPYPFPKENALKWLQNCAQGIESGETIRFAIREKEVRKLIGTIGLHLNKEHQKAELGYWLGKNFWRKGYLTEALKAVLEFGFKELNLNKIYATHFLFNPNSGKVMLKAGMKFEGLQKQEYLQHGEFLDVNRYSLLKQDFKL